VAINITTVDDAIEDNGVKILVHGLAGSGKTTLCATTGAPTLILNVEGGLLSLKGAPSYIKTAKITNIDEFEEYYNYLVQQRNDGDQEFQWIALDSISDIAEQVLKIELDACADPRKSYPAFQARVIGLIKGFRDLAGYNVIMTAKQDMVKDDYTGITLRVPSMPGNKLGPQVPYLFDEVFAIMVEKDEDDEDYRVIQTNRDIMYEAKDRSGKLGMYEPPNLKKILSKIHAGDDPDFAPTNSEESEAEEPESDSLMYWYHDESDSYGECMSSEFEDLCDNAPGGLVEVSKEEYDKKSSD